MGLFNKETPNLDKYSQVYVEGFSAGYQKAYDTLLPIIKDGLTRSAKMLHDEAVDATLRRLGLGGSV